MTDGRIEPLRRVLVANRGEIAVRIVRACHDEGVEAVVAASDADANSLAAQQADDVVHIGRSSPSQSYLRIEQIIAAALLSGCDAVHPGYGFLSERPDLATACATHGLTFVGPTPDAIRIGGDKVAARALAVHAGVAVAGGSNAVVDVDAAIEAAEHLGFPVLVKAAAGGGGRGMVHIDDRDQLAERFAVASAEALAAFGDGRLYVERYIANARHVEVQILADSHGNVIHVGDRDCSIQRRFQKVVEEAPASSISHELREQLASGAIAIARALDYVGAGTVEFLIDVDRGDGAFLEINTRIQVEHPVTEMVTGLDLVREQLRIAAGHPLSVTQDELVVSGHAIECRINAESPSAGFTPSPGTITALELPEGDGVRVDTHVFEGSEIPPFYDSLVAKMIVHGADRADAITRLGQVLDRVQVDGIDTNVDLHRAIVRHADFANDALTTQWLETTLLVDGVAASSQKVG